MPLVVVGTPLGLAGSHRQQRLSTVQRLNLALLVHAEDQSVIGWVQVQPHDVAHFLELAHELGLGGCVLFAGSLGDAEIAEDAEVCWITALPRATIARRRK